MDIALAIINVILTIVSGIGAYQSKKYFKKSRNLTSFLKLNNALDEVGEMLSKLPEALSASNSSVQSKKGFSFRNTLRDIGEKLNTNLMKINSNMPTEYSNEFLQLQKKDGFDLPAYINSYISGNAIKGKEIDLESYNICQNRLVEMQNYLKKVVTQTGEKLK